MRILKLLLLLCVFSCNQKDKTLPASTGSSSEILFVSPDYLWENKLSNKVLDIFSQDIPGIAKSEPAFKILHVNEGQLNSLLKTHTNIIILSSDSTFFEANKWAKNQLVSYLFYNDDANRFNAECNNLFKIYYDKEITSLKNNLLKNSNSTYSKDIQKYFKIDLVIPKEYIKNDTENTIMHFSYNPSNKEVIKHILIYKADNNSTDINYVIDQTNAILKQTLKGSRPNSYVIIEDSFPIEMYNGSYRALWKLHNGFMGGSLIIQPYYSSDELILACALVFDPGSKKRNYIKEFESIL